MSPYSLSCHNEGYQPLLIGMVGCVSEKLDQQQQQQQLNLYSFSLKLKEQK